jgi:hypothetical protein
MCRHCFSVKFFFGRTPLPNGHRDVLSYRISYVHDDTRLDIEEMLVGQPDNSHLAHIMDMRQSVVLESMMLFCREHNRFRHYEGDFARPASKLFSTMDVEQC